MRILLLAAISFILHACHDDTEVRTIGYETDCKKCDVIYTSPHGIDTVSGVTDWSLLFRADPSFIPRMQLWYISHQNDYAAQQATLRIFVNNEKVVEKSDSGVYFKITGFYIP